MSRQNNKPHADNFPYFETMCRTCLSLDRKLYSLQNCDKIILKLVNIISISPSFMVCWECAAILKSIQKFKEQVDVAHKLFYIYNWNKSNKPPKALSNLKISNASSPEDVEFKYKEENDLKATIASFDVVQEKNTEAVDTEELLHNIKVEDTSDVKSDDGHYDAEEVFVEIKEEFTESVVKEEKCDDKFKKKDTLKRNYIYLSNKLDKQAFRTLTTIISSKESEIISWDDKERKSYVYKNFKFKCESCIYGWDDEQQLIEHNTKWHDVKSSGLICDNCHKSYNSQKDLDQHIATHYTVYQCKSCKFRSRKFLMRRHLLSHGLVQCRECGVTFAKVRSFYNHYKTLHKVFVCNHCGKKCKSKNILIRHMDNHNETYECKICNRQYKSRKSYRYHNLIHAPSTDENRYCVKCDIRFDNVHLYHVHVRKSKAHAAERNEDKELLKKFTCPSCPRTYARRFTMMTHYRYVHMNQSNYFCQQCDKYLLNRTKYVEHMKYYHEGATRDKNKLCTTCGRRFSTNQILIKHIRTHSGERPFACELCDSKFTQKQALQSHVRHVHLKKKRVCYKGP